MQKLLKSRILKFLFLGLFVVYAVSPLIGSVESAMHGRINHENSTQQLGILYIDALLELIFDSDNSDNSVGNEADSDDDFLVKKFRAVLKLQDLLDLCYVIGQEKVFDVNVNVNVNVNVKNLPSIAALEIIPILFEGYQTLYSGLAPPVSLLS